VISEAVTLMTEDGLALEGTLDSEGSSTGSLLLCHPHPKMGGTMNAPLLLALREELVARRWAVLRLNFRGIGASQGESGTGEAEVGDARAGLAFLRARMPGFPVAIAGWSFGAAVAIHVACDDTSLAACVAIAPAVDARPGITAGIPPPHSCEISYPILVITGSNDDQVAPAECKRWAEGMSSATYVEVPGANHFFWAKYETLASTIAGFLDRALTEEA
jgi:alpha/beta superfamily hydrolase